MTSDEILDWKPATTFVFSGFWEGQGALRCWIRRHRQTETSGRMVTAMYMTSTNSHQFGEDNLMNRNHQRELAWVYLLNRRARSNRRVRSVKFHEIRIRTCVIFRNASTD